MRVLSASTHIGRPIFTTPGAPAERVAVLRQAFDAMVHDPAFVEQARREKFDIDPSTGESMQQVVSEMMAIPKAQSERLQKQIRLYALRRFGPRRVAGHPDGFVRRDLYGRYPSLPFLCKRADGKRNARIPKDTDPKSVPLELCR